ncbi:hypothetical protein HRR83_008409 [Exophiala dermatitidis]|uniref:Acyl-protein thioesterase 1 n=1 Tax=Exophiala dermatitidis TaxID=5970 RepID=A0AAN6ENG3_EXODE|nr:hypothetical protein HRR75_007733 [Exophiala dermatitidis]KAJ4505894.1 hypothetical protein HRR73_008224 [Exophiala dermatitidis]KAJ4506520.1 hypothetical protein HRR74_008418 [Exophiala dermatitidis]KAJ4533705.1 hypothetical protein HRR77_008457 [Exophiala dermatitidis]KAJ4539377.1 hypothetical protein HRR78_007857 [Exophiala dermatitidis]
MSDRPPYIVPPTKPSSSPDRAVTLIFLHGYGDDADGLPLGIAQQFQFYNKLEYLKWVLPYAPHNHEAMSRAWYVPKALPNAMKPRVPGHEEDETAPDDEVAIMKSVDIIDKLVEEEIKNGTPAKRILVGGFSQGCAVSLVWGLTSRFKNEVGGMVCLSGYMPLRDRIAQLRRERRPEGCPEEAELPEKGGKKWFYVHGTMDMLIPTKMFAQGMEELAKWVDKEDIEVHLYPGMGHSTATAELRDLLGFLDRVVPP